MNDILARFPQRVTFLHAHPDDETLFSGALILEMIARGIDVSVVTATRGERGEIAPDCAANADAGEIWELRTAELQKALALLGVEKHCFLGEPPARASQLPIRRYSDSGMRWIRPNWAGAAADAGSESFWLSNRDAEAADFATAVRAWDAQVIISYASDGGYGHPDHIACYQIAKQVAGQCGIQFWSVAVAPDSQQSASKGYVDLARYAPNVAAVLESYSSQLQVQGDELVHVGGQRQAVPTSVVLEMESA